MRVGAGLLGGDEPGAHPHPGGARREHRGQVAPRGQPPGRDHGDVDAVEDLVEEGEEGLVAVHPSAALDPAHGEHVAARRDGGEGVLEGADLPSGRAPASCTIATSAGSGSPW